MQAVYVFLLLLIDRHRYANRAKNIKNKPKINEDPKDALLREYQEEIKKLRGLLDGQLGPEGIKGMACILYTLPSIGRLE